MVSGLAMAQTAGIDTAAVEASFGNLETALATVGGLIIGAAALAITFKWVKGMIFS
jgi:7-keto-8-aminopelargonate synthetase-like enzyme